MEKTLNPFTLERRELFLDGFPSVHFVVDMARCRDAYYCCCLFNSMETIPISNCSLVYQHSNDMNSFRSTFLKKKIYNHKYNSYKNNSGVCNRVRDAVIEVTLPLPTPPLLPSPRKCDSLV